MQAYLFFGSPGSGKGTQREMLEAYFTEKNYNWKSLEVGPRLRKYTETDPTAFKERVRKVMREGGLVPSALPIALLVQYMDEQKTMSDHLTIDGSGRKLIEAEMLIELLLFFPDTEIHTFLLTVPKEEMFTRLEKRGREDDKREVIEHRFALYNDTTSGTAASIQFLHDHPEVRFHEIDGVGTEREVHQRVRSCIHT